ncbi:hypothetical protein [Clostridium sp.]|uniref:hypothetical protein n=1 Tax=Clostridium sp. TaxID=1506 RepID=UPI003D6CF067
MEMYKKENRYFYRAFGLNIASDIYLPELMKLECKDECEGDVNIYLDRVPEEVSESISDNEYFKISKNELLFNVDGVAKYYIVNGKTIIVEPDTQANNNSVKLFILGSALGVLLIQRDIIPIHGSAVVINGKCVVFTGASGAGKSTISSALRKMGHVFLADDISAVTFNEEGIPLVQPAYPQQKLWSDSLEVMGVDSNKLLKVYDDDEDKYAVKVDKGYSSGPVPISAIFELSQEECTGVEVKQILGIDKLNSLLKNIYRVEYLKTLGIWPDYFKKCLNVSKDTKFFKLIRPAGIFSIEDQVRLIKEKVECL